MVGEHGKDRQEIFPYGCGQFILKKKHTVSNK